MKHDMSERLVASMRERRLIRLTRKFEPSHVRGYVLDVGPTLFIMLLVSDRIWLDGYECFRIGDVQTLEHDPYASFAETALWLRREVRPEVSPVSVTSLADLLRSAADAFPLITIHTEQDDPDCCWIGQVLSVDQKKVQLQEIRPGATWVVGPREFRLNQITRVNFGGDYEDALFIAGGGSPPIADRVLRSIDSPDGSQRVLIVVRPEGVYSYRKQFLSSKMNNDPDSPIFPAGSVPEGSWGPPGPYCGHYDSPMTAEQEALGRVDWLSNSAKDREAD